MATAAAASPNLVTGTTTDLSVLGADDAGEANLKYTWKATKLPSGAKAPTFSANGVNAAKNTTATFSKVGNYTFQVTITDAGGLTATSSVSVTVSQSIAISVSPATINLKPGAIQRFTATARDQFGTAMSSQPKFQWWTTDGTISNSGLLTAPNATVADGTVYVVSVLGDGSAPFTVGNIVSPLAAAMIAPSSGGSTNSQKTLAPLDYALALAGTWLDDLSR